MNFSWISDLIITFYDKFASQIFDRIKTSNIKVHKNERRGNMFNINIPKSKRRRQVNLTNFTGLMFIDIDDCIDASGVKELFTRLPVTTGVWLAPLERMFMPSLEFL